MNLPLVFAAIPQEHSAASTWTEAWADLRLAPPEGLAERLWAAYGEPHRHYHTTQHLVECLDLFTQFCHLAEHPSEVALAIWFHDAVHQGRSGADERQSADWALRSLQEAGASPETTRRIEELVLATTHAAPPSTPDQQLLVDIDLAILGSGSERFSQYQDQIRREYAWVQPDLYAKSRREVLAKFLARPLLYGLPQLQARFEAQARRNLAAALDPRQAPPRADD